MKVLFTGGGTGGHLMPALALAEALQSLRDDIEPVLVGASRGVEADILPKRDAYRYYLLEAEPLYRRTWWRNARWLWKLRSVLRQCRDIIDRERPAFAVGTGGYAAGPMLWTCYRRGVAIGLLESNVIPGLTTRLMARRAAQLHLGFSEAKQHLRTGAHTQVFALGNPITPPPRDRPERATAQGMLGIRNSGGVCFVVGGSQGARGVNGAVSAALDSGALDEITLLWSTGPSMWGEFSRHHDPPYRQVKPFWDPISAAYAACDIVIARAGALTVAELSAWGLPAILIPLPTAAADHQTRNAEAAARAGAAVHLPESQLNAAALSREIQQLIAVPERLEAMADKATERSHPNAAKEIAVRLLTLAD